MSEYTDYYAVRTRDAGDVLRYLKSVEARGIVFDDIPSRVSDCWVVLALYTREDVLGRYGVALHVRIDEDWQSWQLSVISAQGVHTHTFFNRSFYSHVTGVPDGFLPVPPAPFTAAAAADLAEKVHVPWRLLQKTLVPGGFERFCKLLRMPCLNLLDQYLLEDGVRGMMSSREIED